MKLLRSLLIGAMLLCPVASWADVVVATDTFSGASGVLTVVDTNWSDQGFTTSFDQLSGGAGLAQSHSAGNDSGARWNANAFNNDQYSQVILGTSSTVAGAGQGYGPAVRWDTSGTVKTGIRFVCNTSGYELMKFVTGTGTSLSTAASPTCANGDTIYLSATTSGANITIVVKQNGNAITGSPFTCTSCNAGIPSGAAGISHSSSTDSNGTVGITSWEGGNLSAAVPALQSQNALPMIKLR